MADTIEEITALSGGGEMGARMRAFDWSTTPLGPVANWSPSLLTAVSICLNSRFPLLIWWGPELIKIYNDTYAPILGRKHPSALGQPGLAVWPEIWDIIGPMLGGVMSRGEATWSDDQLLMLERRGFPEECYFTFSYSPIRDETGEVSGVFTAVFETTSRVYGEGRLRTVRDLAARGGEARTAEEACKSAARVLSENPEDLPFALVYLLDGEAAQASLEGVAGIEAGSAACPLQVDGSQAGSGQATWPFAEVVSTGRPRLVEDLGAIAGTSDLAGARSATVLPIRSSGSDAPAGFLVAGISPRRSFDDDYRGFLDLVAGHVAGAVSNARAHEAERRRAEELAALNQAKSAFFSNVSHEFRTPLTLILGPLQQALEEDETVTSPVLRERLEMASRSALRLLKLVNTLLDFSRLEAGRMQASYEPVDLAASTAELAGVFRSLVERAGMRFTVDCQPLCVPVYIDRDMWEKIVLNLISNAFKFTLHGEIRAEVRLNEGQAEMTVSDTGTGIPPDQLPYIFERFHRVTNARSRTHEGTGIGLALVQELVQLNGGTIEVSSKVGEGAAFTVKLPTGSSHLPSERLGRAGQLNDYDQSDLLAVIEEAHRWLPVDAELPVEAAEPGSLESQVPSPGSLPGAPRSARVLVVDDNADMRDYLRRLVGQRWQVETAPDGEAALARIRESRPDLVVSDVMMPTLDGLAMLSILRADPATETLPVILLTARAGEEAWAEGFAAGATDYLARPFSARELVARIGSLLDFAALGTSAAQRERVERDRLQKLAEASLTIGKSLSSEEVLQLVADQARRIVGAHRAEITIGEEGSPQFRTAASQSDSDAARAGAVAGDQNALSAPIHGWDGQPTGVLQVTGSLQGTFTQEDESVLIQLAELASVAIENARLYQEAEDALAVRDQFLSSASHELRTPLTGLHGYTQLLMRRAAHGFVWTEREQRMLDVVDEQARRLKKLIDVLLDLSRIHSGGFGGDYANLGLCTLVRRVVGELQITSEDHEIVLHCDVDQLIVHGDDLRLDQALDNVIQNATKYSLSGQPVTVTLDSRDGFACLDVKDQGIGIPADDLARLFQPSYRASNVAGGARIGSGMGLYIVKEIVTRHGGSVELSSTEGLGTTVSVCLPLATEA